MGLQRVIADKIGISVATVSRSLRNDPSISAAMRAKVAETAIRLGYGSPAEIAAGGPPARRNGLVQLGVLCRGDLSNPNTHNSVSLRVIQGMSSGAREHQAMLHIDYLSPQEFDALDRADRWPPALAQGAVRGLALLSEPPLAVLKALMKRFACVMLVPSASDLSLDRVTEDNTRSMGQLVEYLWDLGHRRFGFLELDRTQGSARARFTGYVQALDDRGLIFDPKDAPALKETKGASTDERLAKAGEYVERRLKQGVTAWICPTDHLGYLLMSALRQRGIHAPQDISIAGFDRFDPPHGLPQLTSIDGPFETIGEAAVERMIARIKQPDRPTSHSMFACRLVPGQSTGAPPQR